VSPSTSLRVNSAKDLKRRYRSLQIVGWIAATALLLYCLRQLDPSRLRDVLSLIRWRWIALALVANALILVSWAALWWTVTPRSERPTFRAMFEVNAMASALMNTVPFLGGHAAAIGLLVRKAGLKPQSALSVMALDQLGEGMAKVAIFSVVVIAAPIPDWMRLGIATACIAVAALLIALLLAAHGHAHLAPREGDRGFFARARTVLSDWASRLETLRSTRLSIAALAFALGTKVLEFAGLLAAQHALGVTISLGDTALVLASVVLGSMIPVAPGNVGTYEAGAFLAYRHLGVDPATASALALVSHICFLIPSIGIGYLVGSRALIATEAS
jgi:glycosyltransferase 2 family protein